MNNIKMLYYDKIELSEGIDVNKNSESHEYDICHYWYFKLMFIQKWKVKIWKCIQKMERTFIKFGDIEIKKQKLHQHYSLISINSVDIKK